MLGRLESHTTPKLEVCTYSYDLRNRQLLANWNTATPGTARTYFANGLLKSIDNGVSRSDYSYDSRNLLSAEIQTLAGQPARSVSYGHDADGLRSGLNAGPDQIVDYAWTARGQLASLAAAGPPPLAHSSYDKAGRSTGLQHENGVTELKTYDAAGQLLANEHRKDGALVGGHGYTLDLAGRRSAETFLGDTGTPARSYGYDLADQVTSASYGAGQADSYAYDAMGNRESATLASLGGTTTQYTANNANQYTSISGWPAPVHDANGNLLQQNGVTYTWDSENRLLSLKDATRRIEFTYDGLHRRVTKKVVLLAGSIVESQVHYLYDGWNPIRETSLLTPAQRTDYTWGIDLSGSLQGAGGVGGLLLAEVSDGSGTIARHFHYDGNGNVTEVTDLAGNNLARYRYDAFGNTLVATGTHATANRYRE
jgi:YD repeat-containing protein